MKRRSSCFGFVDPDGDIAALFSFFFLFSFPNTDDRPLLLILIVYLMIITAKVQTTTTTTGGIITMLIMTRSKEDSY